MSEPPAASKPGVLRSAAPGLILFSANLLLGLIVLLSYVWPPPTNPRQAPVGIATATPTLFIINGAPNPASTVTSAIRPAATAHATATGGVYVPAASPTHTPAKPNPTPTSTSTPIISPTPTPTIISYTG